MYSDGNALQLTEEDFQKPFKGKSLVEEVESLSSEIDRIWSNQQRERRRKKLQLVPERRQGFIEARQASTNTMYSICIEENGKEQIVKAEYLGKGSRDYRHFAFFRRQLKGGKFLIHGIPDYSLVKEISYEQHHERE